MIRQNADGKPNLWDLRHAIAERSDVEVRCEQGYIWIVVQRFPVGDTGRFFEDQYVCPHGWGEREALACAYATKRLFRSR